MKIRIQYFLLGCIASTGIIYGAATGWGQANWKDWEAKSDKTLATSTAPDRLQKAEDQLMTSIEIAFKNRVPEKEIIHVYKKMGDLMMQEKKYEEAQKYFLRTVQFANAMGMETDENLEQLHKLETAYEKARDYEQAEQTQSVIVKLIEMDKSPMDPAYPTAVEKQQELKDHLAKFMNPQGLPKVKVAEQKPQSPQEQKQQENLLTGWH